MCSQKIRKGPLTSCKFHGPSIPPPPTKNDPRGRTPNMTQNSYSEVWGRSLGSFLGYGGGPWKPAKRTLPSPSTTNSDCATADDVEAIDTIPSLGCQNPFLLGACLGKTHTHALLPMDLEGTWTIIRGVKAHRAQFGPIGWRPIQTSEDPTKAHSPTLARAPMGSRPHWIVILTGQSPLLDSRPH